METFSFLKVLFEKRLLGVLTMKPFLDFDYNRFLSQFKKFNTVMYIIGFFISTKQNNKNMKLIITWMKQVNITTLMVVVTMVRLNSSLSAFPSSALIKIAKQNATAPRKINFDEKINLLQFHGFQKFFCSLKDQKWVILLSLES